MTTSISGADGVQVARPVVVDGRPQDEPSSSTAASDRSLTGKRTATQVLTPAGQDADALSEQVVEAARKVEELFQTVRRNLHFRDDPHSGRIIVSVIDADSGEIIRQIPPERMLQMAANLERIDGLLFADRA